MDEIRAAVVTVSDKGYAGEREDVSGPMLADLAQDMGATVIRRIVVPDEKEEIIRNLICLADEMGLDLVLTTGGTGLTPRDITPEATRSVIEREVPGIAEVLRFEGYRQTPLAVISRGVAGTRGRTLMVNLPGNPRAVREGMKILGPILPHAIQMIRGEDTEHDHPDN